MTTNTYFIIGGIAVLFIAYMIFLKTIMKKRNNKLLEDFNNNHSNSPLTDEQKRLLSFGGILFYYRGEKILGIKPENSLNEYIGGLKLQWEITNEAEAKETLNDLLSLQRSNEFEPVFLQSSKELSSIQKDISKGLGLDLDNVTKIKSAYAWDICRAVSLAKWCYWVGYLTENETWEIMKKASEIAIKKGENWTDYTISFLLGRTIQGFDLDELIVESKQILTSKGPSLRKIEDVDIYTKYPFIK
ncbi:MULTISPECIES: DUF1266 domain-containing protein [unclassified Flavobacterium]|jgi:hypothetical protein|uniref:DUF1266 domain-containing protein n=1 Tax=unclassified Flavobacterium TaxID=196869 RepID=UPI00057F08DF|nr:MULTISPECIES: DUF1266 domain-containing protein [unclassified Flavobacterium]KIC02149.1 hypothetical protein OA88_10505 [Flavobacterium sp. JRM]MEA9412685.1 DUF1266 domain-containing protein [Flavobacterium sp. PL02]OUL63911.1 hypothetical protein B8T70_02870 [Flavobacterium sp. AJR]